MSKGDSPDLFPSDGIASTNNLGYAAEDGNHILLLAEASFEGGDAYFSSYIFSRGSQGWATQSLSPGPGVHRVEAKLYEPKSLARVGVEDAQLIHVPGQPEENALVDYAGLPGGPYTTVGSLPFSEYGETLVGASADLSHVLVSSKDHELVAAAMGQDEGSHALYDVTGSQPRLVNVANDGTLLNPCGAVLGLGARVGAGATHSAVSSNGSKIIFTAPDPTMESGPGCWTPNTTPQTNTPQLYMRQNGTVTVKISEANAGVSDPSGEHAAVFVGASADGSRVLFLSEGELTSDDTTHAPELYEYDAEAPEGKRLTRISSGESGNSEGNVDFVGAMSSDGSTIYFAAYKELAKGAAELQPAKGGMVNLYRYDTNSGKTIFITAIRGEDYPVKGLESTGRWFAAAFPVGNGRAFEPGLTADANWFTTADGKYLLFGTDLPLTGYDNSTAGNVKCQETLYPGTERDQCVELYRYSATDNSIVCVSCGAGTPVDNAEFTRNTFDTPYGVPPRPMSEDGSYVFFETFNALVPQTTTEYLHVYEWHNGEISLISSPDDPTNAYFLGASANGANVFFGTHAQLVPQDTDVAGDLYDARINGGFVTLPPSQCTGSGCQGVPAAPPIFATPSSVTFEGVGNFAPTVMPRIKPGIKHLTRRQRLARALRKCRLDRRRHARARCVINARARYGQGHKAPKSNRRGK